MERPKPSSPSASQRLARQKQSSTEPELRLRRALHARGLRYRVGYRVANIRCDIVFIRARLIIMVDGCFWHSCPQHSTIPKSNSEWWSQKLAVNRARDVRQSESLEGEGWRVLRVWEHEDPNDVADSIERILQGS